MIIPLKNKIPLLFCALGFWLLVAPWTFGYAHSRICVSDFFVGMALLFLGFFSYKAEKKPLYFLAILIGLWLQLAPLFLWAPANVMYLNDTFVGVLVLVLASLRLGFVGEKKEKGQDIPI